MSTQARTAPLPARDAPVSSGPMNYDTFLTKLGPRDRLNVERHLAACEADPAHAAMWRRVACALMRLASHGPKANGQQTMQFFVPDGKYRMQVFALEDQRDGKVMIYCGDVLDQAVRSGLLGAAVRTEGVQRTYPIPKTRHTLTIDSLDGKSPNPAPFFKDMLGWNRRAIRIVLPITAAPEQVRVVEDLCARSAQKWIKARPA